jgi:hypothetical protein
LVKSPPFATDLLYPRGLLEGASRTGRRSVRVWALSQPPRECRHHIDPILPSLRADYKRQDWQLGAIALLNEFVEKQGEKLIDDPHKRAVLQRDLWLVFSWLVLSKESIDKGSSRERQASLLAVLESAILKRPPRKFEALHGIHEGSYFHPLGA